MKIELLAPARDLACGRAAIGHGADAVYMGGPAFGARAAAGNSIADIEQLVRYAHLYRSRVYIALNTVLADSEIDAAVEQIHQLYGVGVDAVIIQDMGLLQCDLPPISLHASTQCNTRSAAKVKFLEGVGFDQVVLARELSLAQISQISAETTVPLEHFIHGALCVSYSGQCYMSEVMSGRSANRGACAQFCRHKYELRDGDGGVLADNYPLSLHDLNASDRLEELLDAGVSSLKIEGRLKGEQYVKNITAYYRKKLDEIFNRRPEFSPLASGRCEYSFTPQPDRSFNRGSCEYYLDGGKRKVGAILSPKSMGERVGVVKSLQGKAFKISATTSLHNGDGCCFMGEKGELVGFQINRVDGELIFPARPLSLAKGSVIYRNLDPHFDKELQRSSECRKLSLRGRCYTRDDEIVLELEDEDGVCSQSSLHFEPSYAQKPGIGEATIRRQLDKGGDSPFVMGELEVTLTEDFYFAAAAINSLRRLAFDNHQQARLDSYQSPKSSRVANELPWLSDTVDRYDNITNHYAEDFYRRHGVKNFVQSTDGDLALMHSRYCVRFQYGLCGGGKPVKPLYLRDKSGEYRLEFDCKLCEMKLYRN